jgi:hypothetical protein
MTNELNDFNISDLYDSDDAAGALEEAASELSEEDDDEDGDFLSKIRQGTRREEIIANANLPRYGVPLLTDIRIVADPYFYMGDFNVKVRHQPGGRLVNKENTHWFPRLELYPFTTQGYPIPYEGRAELLSEEQAEEELGSNPAGFDFSTVKSTVAESRRSGRISAAQFAEQIYERFQSEGFTLLSDKKTLLGYENYDEARLLLKAVINRKAVMEAIPQPKRERLGFELEGPFMPEIILYLQEYSRKTIERAGLSSGDSDRCEAIRIELLKGARIAREFCERTLTKTEGLIDIKEKKGYDPPDLIHRDPSFPPDLVAMIHLNKQPRDMKALDIAQRTGAAVAAGINQQQAPAPPQPPLQGYIPASEVDEIVNAKVDELKKSFDASLDELKKTFLAQNPAPAGTEGEAEIASPEASKAETGKPSAADKPKTKNK